MNHCVEVSKSKDAASMAMNVFDLLQALRLVMDRLSVVIESDNEDHGGASPDDIAAYENARAILERWQK